MDTGQPVPEPVSVALGCGIRPLQVIHTDLKGYFQFTLGAGTQSNMDFSASNDSSHVTDWQRHAIPQRPVSADPAIPKAC